MDLTKIRRISGAALLTLALLAGLALSGGAPAVAQTVPPDNPAGNPAAPGGAPVVAVDGKIGELSATGFTLNVPGRTLTVLVSAATWIVVGGAAPVEGDMTTLRPNMGVHVEGTRPTDGQIAARVVRELGAGPTGARPTRPDQAQGDRRPGAAGPIHGTVSAVTPSLVTVTLGGGRAVQFQVNAATVVLKNGFASVAALQRGEAVEILARGGAPARPRPDNPATSTSDTAQAGVPFAHLIWVPQANAKLLQGTVERVNGPSVLIRSGGVLLTVQLSNTTVIKRSTDATSAPAAATARDLAVNAPVWIVGTAVAGQARTFAAQAVVVLPVPPAGPSRSAPLPDRRPQP